METRTKNHASFEAAGQLLHGSDSAAVALTAAETTMQRSGATPGGPLTYPPWFGYPESLYPKPFTGPDFIMMSPKRAIMEHPKP